MNLMARRASDRKTEVFSRTFAARLRALRTERGWTQEELGKRIGSDGSGIRSYEIKLHHPPLMTLQKLAATFGVSVDFLLNGPSKPADGFQDRELLELFLKADALHYTRKAVLKQVIEGLLAAEILQKSS
jgi:transcriptional regulator with XRE-family HTH domain